MISFDSHLKLQNKSTIVCSKQYIIFALKSLQKLSHLFWIFIAIPYIYVIWQYWSIAIHSKSMHLFNFQGKDKTWQILLTITLSVSILFSVIWFHSSSISVVCLFGIAIDFGVKVEVLFGTQLRSQNCDISKFEQHCTNIVAPQMNCWLNSFYFACWLRLLLKGWLHCKR